MIPVLRAFVELLVVLPFETLRQHVVSSALARIPRCQIDTFWLAILRPPLRAKKLGPNDIVLGEQAVWTFKHPIPLKVGAARPAVLDDENVGIPRLDAKARILDALVIDPAVLLCPRCRTNRIVAKNK